MHTQVKPLLSVIIPVFNDASNLDSLLKVIYQNSFKDFEVIVVDDCSTDPYVQSVSEKYSVRYHRHEMNRCVAATRNSGAKLACGHILIFFDSDVMVEKGTLQRFADAYKDNKVGFYQPLCSKKAVNGGFGPNLVALIWHFDYKNADRFSLHSQAFSMKKSLFFECGGFDERFTGLGAEEFEFGHRIEKKTPLLSDPSHLLSQNYETVFPRALSLFKRTVRYTLMFLFRTRKFEAQGGTPLAVLSAFLAFVSISSAGIYILALLFAFHAESFLSVGVLFFLLHTAVNTNFFQFLKKEKGMLFSLQAVGAIYLWSAATGTGIFLALVTAFYMILTGIKYDTKLTVETR